MYCRYIVMLVDQYHCDCNYIYHDLSAVMPMPIKKWFKRRYFSFAILRVVGLMIAWEVLLLKKG